MSTKEQVKEWSSFKTQMRGEVKRLSDQNIIMGKDIKTLLTMAEESKKMYDDLVQTIYKGNGKPSIMERLATHATCFKIYGGIIFLIVGGMATAYFQLSAAPPVVAIDFTSGK